MKCLSVILVEGLEASEDLEDLESLEPLDVNDDAGVAERDVERDM